MFLNKGSIQIMNISGLAEQNGLKNPNLSEPYLNFEQK